MKHLYILLLALATTSITTFAQTRYNVKMTVDSVERQFIVVRPSGAVPVGGYPVVVVFHGTSGDGERFYNISGWKEKGEAEKILTVFPSSLEYCVIEDSVMKRTTKWNNGDLQSVACAGQNLKDDVHFMRMMIDSISAVFPINAAKIFATGHSNGGVFTSKLSVEMSDVFSAVAAVAGSINSNDTGTPLRRIPTWYMMGTFDRNLLERLPGEFGLTEVPYNDSVLTILRGPISRYLALLGLDSAYTKDSTALTLTYKFSTPLIPGPAVPFICTVVNGMDHLYPNGTNFPLTAANAFWEFFTRATSSVGSAPPSDKIPAARPDLTLYPNPMHDYLILDGNRHSAVVVVRQ